MSKKMKMAIMGCGDFLRWQADEIKKSKLLEVTKLYDSRKEQSAKFAEMLGGNAVNAEDDIFNDPEIKLVALFVPPCLRESQFVRAAKTGKHVITTKPLASNFKECKSIVAAAKKCRTKAGVIYSRTGDAFVETAKRRKLKSYPQKQLFTMIFAHTLQAASRSHKDLFLSRMQLKTLPLSVTHNTCCSF